MSEGLEVGTRQPLWSSWDLSDLSTSSWMPAWPCPCCWAFLLRPAWLCPCRLALPLACITSETACLEWKVEEGGPRPQDMLCRPSWRWTPHRTWWQEAGPPDAGLEAALRACTCTRAPKASDLCPTSILGHHWPGPEGRAGSPVQTCPLPATHHWASPELPHEEQSTGRATGDPGRSDATGGWFGL